MWTASSQGYSRPFWSARYVFCAMVGMARCAVPARVVAGGTNIRATLEGVAPLHAARTSQRDVPTKHIRRQDACLRANTHRPAATHLGSWQYSSWEKAVSHEKNQRQ